MTDLEQLFTVKEVAAALHCSPGKVRKLIDSKALDAVDIAEHGARNRHWRVREDAVAQFLGGAKPAGRPTLTLVPREVA